jgi:outer membrane protein TolC
VKQALIAHEASVLTALKDVDDALIAYGQELTCRQSLGGREATRRTVEIAQNRWRAGRVTSPVLDAQRSAQHSGSIGASNAQVTTNVMGLYKALGGG